MRAVPSFEDRGIGWSVHHRVGRGMGGSKQAWVNGPSNLVLLDGSGVTGCHGEIEANREAAYETGWLVRRHGTQRPVQVPINHALYGWVWLTEDGRAEPADIGIPF